MLMDLGLIMVWVSLSSSIIVNKDCHDILQHGYWLCIERTTPDVPLLFFHGKLPAVNDLKF